MVHGVSIAPWHKLTSANSHPTILYVNACIRNTRIKAHKHSSYWRAQHIKSVCHYPVLHTHAWSGLVFIFWSTATPLSTFFQCTVQFDKSCSIGVAQYTWYSREKHFAHSSKIECDRCDICSCFLTHLYVQALVRLLLPVFLYTCIISVITAWCNCLS